MIHLAGPIAGRPLCAGPAPDGDTLIEPASPIETRADIDCPQCRTIVDEAAVLVQRIRATAFGHANGYLLTRPVDADTLVAVLGTASDQGQILRGGYDDMAGVSDRWTFATLADATTAFGLWWLDEWKREPGGWVRHQPSNRRRRYNAAGEVLDEWIAP